MYLHNYNIRKKKNLDTMSNSLFVESLLNFLDMNSCPELLELLSSVNPRRLNYFLDLEIDLDTFSFQKEIDRRDRGYYDVYNNQTKETYQEKYTFPELIKKYYLLPWREDQRQCITKFLNFLLPSNNNRVMYIQAIFGAGKTTMLKAFIFFFVIE